MTTRNEPRYLCVEAPDTKAVVDFLAVGVVVEISTEADGSVRIQARASHGEGSSTWDDHDFEFTLPEREVSAGD